MTEISILKMLILNFYVNHKHCDQKDINLLTLILKDETIDLLRK